MVGLELYYTSDDATCIEPDHRMSNSAHVADEAY